MKNFQIKFLAIALIALGVLASCGDDDDDDGDSAIVGTWIAVSETATGCDDDKDNYNETFVCTDSECGKLIFSSNGEVTATFEGSGVNISVEGTYSVNGSTLSITLDGETDSGSFAISGSTLTLTVVDTTDGCTTTSTYRKE